MLDIKSMDPAAPQRNDWTREEILALHAAPLSDLMFLAQGVLRANFNGHEIQRSRLLNIKTGGCAENCGYCSQSAFAPTGLKASKLMPVKDVIEAAQRAKDEGAGRFCMGAAWRELKDRDVDTIVEMIEGVKGLGMETCMTLGMLTRDQAQKLGKAGLDYYNHNLDTGPDYYPEVVSTRTYQDRLDTLAVAREAGMNLCCGGILGMGEEPKDRADLLVELAKLTPHPESVPINRLVPIAGTRLSDVEQIPVMDFARWIAVARIVFPQSYVRLAAGRDEMSEEQQALCILAGANSLFVGEELLTTPNPGEARDTSLFAAVEGA